MKQQDPVRYKQMMEFVKDSPYRQHLVGVTGDAGEYPMLIFHSGKYFDMEGMGLGNYEMPQFLPNAKETAIHGGDIGQSAPFGNSFVTTSVGPPRVEGGAPSVQLEGGVSELMETYRTDLKTYWRNTIEVLPEGPEGDALYNELSAAMRTAGDRWMDKLAPDPDNPANMMVPAWNATRETLQDFFDMPISEKMTDRITAEQGMKVNQMLGMDDQPAHRGIEAFEHMKHWMRSFWHRHWFSHGQTMFPLVFRGKRPFVVPDMSNNNATDLAMMIRKWPGWDDESLRKFDKIGNLAWDQRTEANTLLREILEGAGFDHLLYINRAEGPGRPSVIVWDQSLFKPLYGSAGFDRSSASWLKGVAAAPLASIFEERD